MRAGIDPPRLPPAGERSRPLRERGDRSMIPAFFEATGKPSPPAWGSFEPQHPRGPGRDVLPGHTGIDRSICPTRRRSSAASPHTRGSLRQRHRSQRCRSTPSRSAGIPSTPGPTGTFMQTPYEECRACGAAGASLPMHGDRSTAAELEQPVIHHSPPARGSLSLSLRHAYAARLTAGTETAARAGPSVRPVMAAIAQLAEHPVVIREATGSTPVRRPTIDARRAGCRRV